MKRVIALMLCLVLVLTQITITFAENAEYPLLNGGYVRLLGRGEVKGEDSRTFNWPNAGFEFEFSGKLAEVYVDEAKQGSSQYNGSYFTVALYDGEDLVRTWRIKLNAGWNTIYTYTDGDPDVKKIMLARSSEAWVGTVRMSRIRCDAQPTATKERARKIEFIGDSYTSGWGNSPELSTATSYSAQNTDNWNSYTGFVTRHYNADSRVISYGGKGIYANRKLSELDYTMSHQFNCSEIYTDTDITVNMSTEAAYDFSDYQPNLVTVWLGTNDIAAPVPVDTFKTAYISLLDNIRAKYPDAAILCMAIPRNNMYYNTISDIVNDDVRGAKNRYYFYSVDNFAASGIDTHPNVAEHRAIAEKLIEKIDSIPGVWESPQTDDTMLMSLRADYNTGKVTVFGNSGNSNEHISALVLKADITPEESGEDDAKYVGQTTTNQLGDYELSFKVERLSGEYSFYMNSMEINSLQKKEFKFTNHIPTMLVQKDNINVTEIKQLQKDDTLTVTLSGFKAESGFSGLLAVSQLKDGKVLDIDAFNASTDSRDFGTEIVKEVKILEGCDKVKVIYINQASLVPMIGMYEIK